MPVRLVLLTLSLAVVLMLGAAPVAPVAGPDSAAAATKKTTKKKASKKKPRMVRRKVRLRIGIADQKSDMFSDPRFAQMKIKYVRRSVAWDALEYDWQLKELDTWMFGAWLTGAEPLVTFARSRIDAKRHHLPTRPEFRAAVTAFRARYPWVRNFVAWNESNHFGEPTGRKPKLAALLYRDLVKLCPDCKVLAADLVDYPNMVKWARSFIRYAKMKPKYWGLHNYLSANRKQIKRTRDLVRALKGAEIWLTEVGGLVSKDQTRGAKVPQGRVHAARVTRFIFDDLATLSRRITRVYVYHWNDGGVPGTWDSGLIGRDGTARPALAVLHGRILREQKRPSKVLPEPKSKKRKKSKRKSSRTTRR